MLVKSQAKYIQSLGQKKPRDETGLFIAEGPKIVKDLLQEIPERIKQVYALKRWIDENQSLLTSTETIEVDETELQKISQLTTSNQVLAVIRQFEQPLFPGSAGKITLALDTIQDPGNLGTLVRIADWFGVHQVVCSPACADMYNPKVVQATMSSIVRVKLMYTDLEQWLSSIPQTRIYAAMLEGEDVTTMDKLTEGVIIIGNESKGIDANLLKLVNGKITIPRKGRAESLNAAVAAGIILSHLT